MSCATGVCVCVYRQEHTFFNDTSFVIKHTLNLAASHIHQASLLHKGLAPVEACAIGQVGPHRDQKANVMLSQPYTDIGWREQLERKRDRGIVRQREGKRRDRV